MPVLESLVDVFAKNTSLTSLSLRQCSLSSPHLSLLSELIKSASRLPSLSLDLGYNSLGSFVASLQRPLSSNWSIAHLILAGNGLNDEDMGSIARVIAVNRTLQSLDLSANEFTHEGMRHLVRA